MTQPLTATPATTNANDTLRRRMRDLVSYGSLEIGAHHVREAAKVAELLPAGTRVFVNHLPRQPLAHSLDALAELRQLGLEPVPHIAVRRLQSRDEARDFLAKANKLAAITKVLVIAGDLATPMGPYEDAAGFLAEPLLRDNGIREVGLAAYPEGHARIARGTLEAAFASKLDILARAAIEPFAVTQFTFAPVRTVELCATLGRRYPNLPVMVGLPGPTSLPRLIRYAERCGVGASLRALQSQGMAAVNLITRTDPTDQIEVIAQHQARGAISNVVGVHLFSFGGPEASATLMNGLLCR